MIKKIKGLIPIGVIILLGFAAYYNSLNSPFIWDDSLLIQENIFIRDWVHIPKFFTKNINAGAGQIGPYYRPLLMLSFMPDYALWKLNEHGYHLTTVMIHIFAALCLYWFVYKIFNDRPLSFLTAILFIIHPIMGEDVAYITGRADSMALVFMLLCIIYYLKYLETKATWRYLACLIYYISALLSKENSIVVPMLLVIYHYSFKKRLEFKPVALLFLAAIFYLVLRQSVLTSCITYTNTLTDIAERMPGFFIALTNYVRLLFFPLNLHIGYGQILFSFSDPRVTAGMLILMALLICAVHREKAKGVFSFSILWFFLALLPVSNTLYPASEYMAERYLYIPSVGFFLIIAYVLTMLYRNKTSRLGAIIIIAYLLISYTFLTIKHNEFWKDPISFYKRRLSYTPYNSQVHNNLGNVYSSQGNYQEAMDCFKRAIIYDRTNSMAYSNLGVIYADIFNNKEIAIRLFKDAIRVEPQFTQAYYNLGVAYSDLGDKRESAKWYEKALALHPDYLKAHINISGVYYELGLYELAKKHYQKALELGAERQPGFKQLLESNGKK